MGHFGLCDLLIVCYLCVHGLSWVMFNIIIVRTMQHVPQTLQNVVFLIKN